MSIGDAVLRKDEFYILNNVYNASIGRASSFSDVYLKKVQNDRLLYQKLEDDGLIDRQSGVLTRIGLQALEPYKVDNAVILAAGSATRFIPLSLEQPKGLYEVKGERLIDRQIEQLHEAGIHDIIVVLGYKKEQFQYLEEKYNVKLIFNPKYNVRNNVESLYCAKEELKNTYICVIESF